MGISQSVPISSTAIPTLAGVFFSSPRPLPPALDCSMRIASKDSSQIKVTSFRILKESELPPNLK